MIIATSSPTPTGSRSGGRSGEFWCVAHHEIRRTAGVSRVRRARRVQSGVVHGPSQRQVACRDGAHRHALRGRRDPRPRHGQGWTAKWDERRRSRWACCCSGTGPRRRPWILELLQALTMRDRAGSCLPGSGRPLIGRWLDLHLATAFHPPRNPSGGVAAAAGLSLPSRRNPRRDQLVLCLVLRIRHCVVPDPAPRQVGGSRPTPRSSVPLGRPPVPAARWTRRPRGKSPPGKVTPSVSRGHRIPSSRHLSGSRCRCHQTLPPCLPACPLGVHAGLELTSSRTDLPSGPALPE